jgi:dipeptidyl aminopeptidase/acylaminoacyl peptidase
MLLTAFGQWTKKAGFYMLTKGNLEKLIYEDKSFGRVTKAKNSDKLMYTISTFQDFPNYYISDSRFTFPKKVTDANSWQSDYIWGRRILFDFENSGGVRLQGTLAIPDTYKEGEKLPMHVNYYEKNSQSLHRYTAPRVAGSPNFAGLVSNGYLVMQPDIHFNTRTTHSDMLDCIEAAVKKVIEMGYADPERISLHGHSFSGQGSAYIATRSNMFAAIVYGAGATNLVSDFNQLWKTSGTNQHRYDTYGQGRFGTNPYDDFELYRQESAITHARTMDTPLLILHGTADGSVEWLQAVEFYNALRFNGKKVILLSYPGAGHGLRKIENQRDFQKRTREFLDHYMKDKPAAEWMIKGRPFIKKPKK